MRSDITFARQRGPVRSPNMDHDIGISTPAAPNSTAKMVHGVNKGFGYAGLRQGMTRHRHHMQP